MRRVLAPAMILAMFWPAAGLAAVPDGMVEVFGPSTFTRGRAAPTFEVNVFSADDGQYTLLVEDLGPKGALVQVWLNGEQVVSEEDLAGSGRRAFTRDVSLVDENTLVVLLAGKPGSSVQVTIYGAAAPAPAPSAAWQEPCAGRTALFTVPPVALPQLTAVVPLGALRPPDTTLPAFHLSLSPLLDAFGVPDEVAVYAPGRATLLAVERRQQGSTGEVSLHLQPCQEVRTSLRHLVRLAPEIESMVDGTGERFCPDPESCIDAVEIEVAAGSLLGYAGGADSQPVAFSVEDQRQVLPFVNPDRYRVTSEPGLFSSTVPPDVAARVLPHRLSAMCGLDYFDATNKEALEARIASADGTRPRIALPLCGEHMQDVSGTAQGNWFAGPADGAVVDESTALALVHDHLDPSVGVFSVANVPAWGADTYVFTPQRTGGFVNTDFDLVQPGVVYCYQGLRGRYGSLGGVVFLEVFADSGAVPNRLRIERRTVGDCSSVAWSFSAGAQVLQR